MLPCARFSRFFDQRFVLGTQVQILDKQLIESAVASASTLATARTSEVRPGCFATAVEMFSEETRLFGPPAAGRCRGVDQAWAGRTVVLPSGFGTALQAVDSAAPAPTPFCFADS